MYFHYIPVCWNILRFIQVSNVNKHLLLLRQLHNNYNIVLYIKVLWHFLHYGPSYSLVAASATAKQEVLGSVPESEKVLLGWDDFPHYKKMLSSHILFVNSEGLAAALCVAGSISLRNNYFNSLQIVVLGLPVCLYSMWVYLYTYSLNHWGPINYNLGQKYDLQWTGKSNFLQFSLDQ